MAGKLIRTASSAVAVQRQRKSAADIYKRVSNTGALGLVGEACGLTLGIFIPDAVVGDWQLGHICGMLAAGLNELGLFRKLYRTPSGQELANCLADANLMFAQKLINKQERKSLRDKCIQAHPP